MSRILIVEDDRLYRNMFSDLLVNHGYEVTTVNDGSEGIYLLETSRFDLVITDLVMPGVDGMTVLTMAKELDPSADVIIVTGHADVDSAISALKRGARDYIVKPINSYELLHAIAQCIEQRRILNENEELKRMLELHQTSRTIAGCLDVKQLYHHIMEAFAHEIGVARALAFLHMDSGFVLKNIKGITSDEAERYAELIQPHLIRDAFNNPLLKRVLFTPPAESGAPEQEEAQLIFLVSREALRGVVVLFSDSGARLPNFESKNKNVSFLLEQSLLALENAENYAVAKNMLFIDDLSGLFNQRYLDVVLDREMKRSERFASQLAVLFLDMDSFKQVNDKYGHMVGSRILAEMGQLLKKLVRDVDIVIRYGGDEYTIILVETSPELAATIAERIRSVAESHVFMADEGYDIRITCSIGYACCPDDTLSKKELMEMADQAMYAGKRSGKNCVVRFTKPS